MRIVPQSMLHGWDSTRHWLDQYWRLSRVSLARLSDRGRCLGGSGSSHNMGPSNWKGQRPPILFCMQSMHAFYVIFEEMAAKAGTRRTKLVIPGRPCMHFMSFWGDGTAKAIHACISADSHGSSSRNKMDDKKNKHKLLLVLLLLLLLPLLLPLLLLPLLLLYCTTTTTCNGYMCLQYLYSSLVRTCINLVSFHWHASLLRTCT